MKKRNWSQIRKLKNRPLEVQTFQRGNIKSQLTRLQTYYQGLDLQNLTAANVSQLEYRLNKIESIYDEYNEIQLEIEFILENAEDVDLQTISNESNVRVEFENSYFDLITVIKDTITNFYNRNEIMNNNEQENMSVKLPTIKLPTFNGCYDRWLEFRDSFVALVDSNDSISEIQKFYYLRSSLEAEAAHLVASIEVSASNYAIAWGLLKDRFENKSCQPTDNWDTLIIHMLTSKFDNVTRRDWESYKLQDELPTMQDINAFLKNKCDILEKLELNKSEKCNKQVSKFDNKQRLTSHVSMNDKFSCYYCKADHAIYHCDNFLKLDVNSRFKEINKRKLCHNCLHPGHAAHQCKRSGCRKCKRKHNSVLHHDTREHNPPNEHAATTTNVQSAEASTSVAFVGHTINKKDISQVLLSTALVYVKDISGNLHTARVLLDQGSQSHFITDALCNKLALRKFSVDCAITGVGQTRSEAEFETSLTIMSRINDFNINISCVVLPKITQQLPINSFDKSILDLPNKIQLADPEFNISSKIDIFVRPVRCLHQLGLDNLTQHPRASEVIMNDFYVDDLLSGSNEASKLIQLQRDVTSILISGGFELRKWLSNKPELVDNFLLNDNLDSNILQLGENEPNKTLGILWNAQADTIQYAIKNVNLPSKVTKRYILSVTAQIFDPLGLLGPVVIVAKIILQLLWQEKISWDEPLPNNILKKWNAFCTDLPLLNELTIPRHIGILHANNFELHAFADASQIAYGACVYIRYNLPDNSYETKLLCAKSRVAPLKTISLPRLELCAALLLAQLVEKVRTSSTINFSHSYYWSDSKITLCWIRGPPSKWKTFIGNRVSEIQQLTNIEDWHHVSSNNNCADLISRGVNSRQLLQSKLWWHGPSFLEGHNSSWNLNDDFTNESIVVPEMRIITNLVIDDYEDFEIFSRYSSLSITTKQTPTEIQAIIKANFHLNSTEQGNATQTIANFSIAIPI
ncbi:hypothetical protein NQ317_004701 [Molorchus minor]|uniref:Peptidase aspartic putative domain-containing protein n=1 Tax=Molorchus minor TaxID=1323400 RepID=A0ABQ9IZH8_9CUCU|nr:hypothetical protein NQ317_004701 [Molorchus minor]